MCIVSIQEHRFRLPVALLSKENTERYNNALSLRNFCHPPLPRLVMTNHRSSTDENGDGSSTEAELFERKYQMRKLLDAVSDCEWPDAQMVMVSLLEEFRAGPPSLVDQNIDDEARNWADAASYDELQTYFLVIGRKLLRSGLGVRGRARLATRLLADLSSEEQRKVFDELRGSTPQT